MDNHLQADGNQSQSAKVKCITHLGFPEMREDTLINLEESFLAVEYGYSQAGGQKVVDMVVREDARKHVKVSFADGLCPLQSKRKLRGGVGWNSRGRENGHISTEQSIKRCERRRQPHSRVYEE